MIYHFGLLLIGIDLKIKLERRNKIMSRYYPYGTFCDRFGCWADDVVDITDGNNDCNGDCSNCRFSSKPK